MQRFVRFSRGGFGCYRDMVDGSWFVKKSEASRPQSRGLGGRISALQTSSFDGHAKATTVPAFRNCPIVSILQVHTTTTTSFQVLPKLSSPVPSNISPAKLQ